MSPENDTKKPDFEKAELDLLLEGLKRTHEERFKMITLLMKRNTMLKKAKITQYPLLKSSKPEQGIFQANKKVMEYHDEKKSTALLLKDKQAGYGFIYKSEDERLLEDIKRPYIEKLQLFTRMLRRNATLNKFIIQQHSL